MRDETRSTLTDSEVHAAAATEGSVSETSTQSWTIGHLFSDVTPERLRIWGIRSGISVLDQGLTSVAGLALSLLLARWLSSEPYGVFALIYATVLFLCGFHSVLLMEPMTVFGPAGYADRMSEYFTIQMKIHLVVTAVLSGAMFLTCVVIAQFGIHKELVSAAFGASLALPFLFVAWLVRRMCYVIHRPAVAIRGSILYLLIVVGGLIGMKATGLLSPSSAFLLMGLAGVLSVLFMIRPLGVFRHATSSLNCGTVWCQNWSYGKWLIASTALFSIASQGQTYVVASIMGVSAAGVLRATMIPSLVMVQIVTATALLVLPSMAADFGNGKIGQLRKKALLSTIALTGMALAYAGVLAAFSQPIEWLLFGGKFASYAALIPLLALVPVCNGFALGFGMAVRACQKPQFDLVANAVSAPVGLVTAVVFIHLWGIAGAVISQVVAAACYGMVFCWAFLKNGRQSPAPQAATYVSIGQTNE